MTHEIPLVAPVQVNMVEVLVPDHVEAPIQSMTTPSPEQVRASEAAFTKNDESHLVAGLMGMWTGTLLLHDLAVEHFDEDEEDARPRKEDRSHP